MVWKKYKNGSVEEEDFEWEWEESDVVDDVVEDEGIKDFDGTAGDELWDEM